MAFMNAIHNGLYGLYDVDGRQDEAMPQQVSLPPAKRVSLMSRVLSTFKRTPRKESISFCHLNNENIGQYLGHLAARRETLFAEKDDYELGRVTDEIRSLNADPQEFMKRYNEHSVSSRMASSELDEESGIPFSYDIDSRVYTCSS